PDVVERLINRHGVPCRDIGETAIEGGVQFLQFTGPVPIPQSLADDVAGRGELSAVDLGLHHLFKFWRQTDVHRPDAFITAFGKRILRHKRPYGSPLRDSDWIAINQPMPLTVTSWNINSVRLRINLVAKFIKAVRPDVLCLQETKCPDDKFPKK